MLTTVQANPQLSSEATEANKPGIVYTFYSYKGGVGRSMALANAAVLLAERGKRVLTVDWDLEAPGLEKFFSGSSSLVLSRSRDNTPGMVDLITSFDGKQSLAWHDCLIKVSSRTRPFPGNGTLQLITAGMLQGEDRRDYIQRLRALDWEALFNLGLGNLLERWRLEWIKEFDFILIDSRTGISDIGNICTILLPDLLVLVFTTNDQSVDGIADVMRRSRAAQSRLPLSRGRLAAVPLLSRDEREKENELASEWRNKIGNKLGDFYRDWLPPHTTPNDVLQKLYIPSIAFWSFGEKLPVVEKPDEIGDSRSIVAAYARLARFLDSQLDWTKIEGQEGAFNEVVRRAEEERKRAEEQLARARSEREQAERMRRMLEKEERAQARRQAIFNFAFLFGIPAIVFAVGIYLGFYLGVSRVLRAYGLGLLGSAAFRLFSALQEILFTVQTDITRRSRNARQNFWAIWRNQAISLMLMVYAPALPVTLFTVQGSPDLTSGWLMPFFVGAGSYAFLEKAFGLQSRLLSKRQD